MTVVIVICLVIILISIGACIGRYLPSGQRDYWREKGYQDGIKAKQWWNPPPRPRLHPQIINTLNDSLASMNELCKYPHQLLDQQRRAEEARLKVAEALALTSNLWSIPSVTIAQTDHVSDADLRGVKD